MACGLALLFDEGLERQVIDLQEVLRTVGIQPETRYPPHVTLWVSDEVHDAIPVETARHIVAHAPLDVALGSLGCFALESCVAFLAPLPSIGLIDLHALATTHAEEDGVIVDRYYQADAWVPHCTLATDVDLLRLPDIARAVSTLELPLRGRFIGCALIDGASGRVIDRVTCDD